MLRLGQNLVGPSLDPFSPATSILEPLTTGLHLPSGPPGVIFPALLDQHVSLCLFVPVGLPSSDLM